MSATHSNTELREIATDEQATENARQMARDLLDSRGVPLKAEVLA